MSSGRNTGPPLMRVALVAIPLLLVLSVACSAGAASAPAPAATPHPLPTPVEVSLKPNWGTVFSNPAFEAIPGAKAYFGRLEGAEYQIEVSDNWNHRLIVYLRGFPGSSNWLFVQKPDIREYLIRNGYAWAASSYSTNQLEPGTAADDSAALWDYFVSKFGVPEYSYVMGASMGGGGTIISSERYADRYDGGLALCAMAGVSEHARSDSALLIAAAFVAGVTQPEWDASTPSEIMLNQARPVVNTGTGYDDLEALWIRMTGGWRPLAYAGYEEQQPQIQFAYGFDNRDLSYDLGWAPERWGGRIGTLTNEEFNERVIRYRVPGGPPYDPRQDPTGQLAMPLLTVNLTGETIVPLSEAQYIRRIVDAAGQGDLLVQRTVRGQQHCGFTASESEKSFEALVGWVERGEKPSGEDVLNPTEDLGGDYTRLPRLESPEATDMPGFRQRLRLSGSVSFDGQPVESPFLRVIAEKEGLLSECNYTWDPIVRGKYRAVVAPSRELSGCGDLTATIYLETATGDGSSVFSREAAKWPSPWNGSLKFDATFSSADRQAGHKGFTVFHGQVFDSSGTRMPQETRIDAYIGWTLCGTTSLSPVATLGSESYTLLVVGPDSRPGCDKGGTVQFLVDGKRVAQTGINNLDEQDIGQQIDLVTPGR